MHRGEAISDPRAEWRRWRRVLSLLALAYGLIALSAVVAGELGSLAWVAAVFGVAVVALALPRSPLGRAVVRGAVGVYALGLSLAVSAIGVGDALAGVPVRVSLLGDNPHAVGAGAAVATLAWAAVAPRRRWVWWVWPLAGFAVFMSGSRTAAAALVLGGMVWAAIQAARSAPHVRALALAGIALLPLALAAAWQFGVVECGPNLLSAPNDFRHGAWSDGRAERILVEPDAAPGPYPGTSAQRVTVQAPAGSSLVLLQGLGRSEPGVPYVASVYLRADEPQTLVLSSHRASVRCEVRSSWERCVTPVGYGDGSAMRQHRFLTAERGGSFDVYVYGAQYERGEEATAFVGRPAWWPQALVNRFDLRWMLRTGDGSERRAVQEIVVERVRAQPLFGYGRAGAERTLRDPTAGTTTSVRHAHNLGLQLLLEGGVMGLLGWLLALVALGQVLPRAAWPALAPLAVGVLTANTADVTLFTRWSFYVMLAAVGVAASMNAHRR